MHSTEVVTDFKLDGIAEEGVLVSDLLTAINKHCGNIAEEYDFSMSPALSSAREIRIPASYRFLIAYAIKGGSEGYYVHIGAILRQTDPAATVPYVDFGFAKTWSAASAYALANAAQRFLTDESWN